MHVPVGIEVIARRVREARRSHPWRRHPLAVAPRRKQAIDNFLVGVWGTVGQKRVDLGRRRREARQIESHTPDERRPIGFRGRLQAFMLQSLQHEPVDPILWPRRVGHPGQLRPHGTNE